MWSDVRRELRRLDWEAATPGSEGDLLTEWAATVRALLAFQKAVRRPEDPFTLLAIATSGAVRAGAGTVADPSPPLTRIRDAINDASMTVAGMPSGDRAGQLSTGVQVAYELAHHVRLQASDGQVREWLLAGEMALDGALHAPASRTATGAGLAAWQSALAAVQRDPDEPILKRGVTLGHSAILCAARVAVEEAARSGALPADYSRSILTSMAALEDAHQATLDVQEVPPRLPSRATQAVMLRLGTAVQKLTDHADPLEDPAARLDALLRTGMGQAALVAGLTGDPAARRPADQLQRLALEYLANPRILRHVEVPAAPAPSQTPAREPASIPAATHGTWQPVTASIASGTVLGTDAVTRLCRARDLGVAAADADPRRPPVLLNGTDPATWPQLAADGRQAVADLVASVTPMVYAATRGVDHAEDARGEMFLHLMRAAHTFDPTRVDSTRWSTYAWHALQHVRWRGVDAAGVPERRRGQPARTVSWDGFDPIGRSQGPEDLVETQVGVEAIKAAVDALPARLREPLLDSIAGQSDRAIGDGLGVSPSTARRRIHEARDVLRHDLARAGIDAEPHPGGDVSEQTRMPPGPRLLPDDRSAASASQSWTPDVSAREPWNPPSMIHDSATSAGLVRAQRTSHEPVFRSGPALGRGVQR